MEFRDANKLEFSASLTAKLTNVKGFTAESFNKVNSNGFGSRE